PAGGDLRTAARPPRATADPLHAQHHRLQPDPGHLQGPHPPRLHPARLPGREPGLLCPLTCAPTPAGTPSTTSPSWSKVAPANAAPSRPPCSPTPTATAACCSTPATPRSPGKPV